MTMNAKSLEYIKAQNMILEITETQAQVVILALQEMKANEYNFRLSTDELVDIQTVKDKLTKQLHEDSPEK